MQAGPGERTVGIIKTLFVHHQEILVSHLKCSTPESSRRRTWSANVELLCESRRPSGRWARVNARSEGGRSWRSDGVELVNP